MPDLQTILEQTFHLSPGTVLEDSVGPGDIAAWDSVGHIGLMTALETTYSIEFDIEDMLEIESIADIKQLLERKGATEVKHD